MSTTSIYATYKLTADGNEPVNLSIATGYAQNSVTDIRIDNARIAGDAPDGSFTKEKIQVSLGNSGSLYGKKLLVNTLVHDINPDTDMTSINLKITGGATPYNSSMSATVDPLSKTILYTYYISFYK